MISPCYDHYGFMACPYPILSHTKPFPRLNATRDIIVKFLDLGKAWYNIVMWIACIKIGWIDLAKIIPNVKRFVLL